MLSLEQIAASYFGAQKSQQQISTFNSTPITEEKTHKKSAQRLVDNAESEAERRIIGMLKEGDIKLHVFEALKQEWESKEDMQFANTSEKYVIHFPDALDRCFSRWVANHPEDSIGSRSGFVKNISSKGFMRLFTKGVNATRVEASRWWYKSGFSAKIDEDLPELVAALSSSSNQLSLMKRKKETRSPRAPQKRRSNDTSTSILPLKYPYVPMDYPSNSLGAGEVPSYSSDNKSEYLASPYSPSPVSSPVTPLSPSPVSSPEMCPFMAPTYQFCLPMVHDYVPMTTYDVSATVPSSDHYFLLEFGLEL